MSSTSTTLTSHWNNLSHDDLDNSEICVALSRAINSRRLNYHDLSDEIKMKFDRHGVRRDLGDTQKFDTFFNDVAMARSFDRNNVPPQWVGLFGPGPTSTSSASSNRVTITNSHIGTIIDRHHELTGIERMINTALRIPTSVSNTPSAPTKAKAKGKLLTKINVKPRAATPPVYLVSSNTELSCDDLPPIPSYDEKGPLSVLLECGVCMEKYALGDMMNATGEYVVSLVGSKDPNNCMHYYCRLCYRSTLLANIGMSHIKCPDHSCKAMVHDVVIRNVLKPSESERFITLRMRNDLQGVEGAHFCKQPDCHGAVIVEPNVTQFICPVSKCRSTHCVNCGDAWHPNRVCDYKIDPELKALLDKGEGQMCPSCGNFVTKNEGCMHMTCKCGENFCYECGTPMDGRNFACRVGGICTKKKPAPVAESSSSSSSTSSSSSSSFAHRNYETVHTIAGFRVQGNLVYDENDEPFVVLDHDEMRYLESGLNGPLLSIITRRVSEASIVKRQQSESRRREIEDMDRMLDSMVLRENSSTNLRGFTPRNTIESQLLRQAETSPAGTSSGSGIRLSVPGGYGYISSSSHTARSRDTSSIAPIAPVAEASTSSSSSSSVPWYARSSNSNVASSSSSSSSVPWYARSSNSNVASSSTTSSVPRSAQSFSNSNVNTVTVTTSPQQNSSMSRQWLGDLVEVVGAAAAVLFSHH